VFPGPVSCGFTIRVARWSVCRLSRLPPHRPAPGGGIFMHPFTDPAHGLDLTDSETMVPVTTEVVVPVAQTLLTWLLDGVIVLPEEWDELPARDRDEITAISSNELLLGRLVHRHLLTPFQADAVRK